MIASHCHTRDWIAAQKESLFAADAEILERAIFALTLLCALARTNLDFLFKGGTSLLLHLPVPQRLSIDIDIVCDTSPDSLKEILDEIIEETPFTRWEEQDRGADRLPKRVHFKLFYASPTLSGEERPILLDVVTEPNRIEEVEQKPIQTSFIECTTETLVTVPSVNALLGDKMTAFAPNTIGVPLNDRYSQQVIKQLFDIAQLYDLVTNPEIVSRANRVSFDAECSYRTSLVPSYEEYFDDAIETCRLICSLDLKGFEKTDETMLLRKGVTQLSNHLINTRFKMPQAKVAAAKAAALLSAIRRDPLPASLPAYQPENAAELKALPLPLQFRALEKLKQVNPESYFYWSKVR